MISIMVQVYIYIIKVIDIKEILNMEKEKEKDSIIMLTVINMMVVG